MHKLIIDGEVEHRLELTFDDLCAFPVSAQIEDVSRLDPKRKGSAVTLLSIIDSVRPASGVRFLGLHASKDDFHASIPLADVRDRAILIYKQDARPLDEKAGGPFRFFIPDHKACKTDEIDECANVKFVDRIEFSSARGFDNRPHDEVEHESLHARQG